MGKGAVHPNGSNFCRALKYNIVDKMRTLVETNLYDRPRWLEWAERAPPIEIHNISLKSRYNNNKYIDLVKFLLKKYPHLRFQDCYVEGNNNVKGYDFFRNDHIITQMATHQLYYMNRGYGKKEALERVEKEFYNRRMELEKKQKINMCLSIDKKIKPLYTNGYAYLYEKMVDNEKAHLGLILKRLRTMREKLEREQRQAGAHPHTDGSGKDESNEENAKRG
ncbi:hypothetical protein PVNG_06271 [Plasmodium vivax North Korean]|nr:hypothetical protein PVNG_04397 [Plasmodium vivax North Korean]KNA02017.1 hypothetical protein PVNG_06271 [Plasmodium vivax North Korean]